MSKWHKIRQTHPNSVEAYYSGKLNNEFSDREEEIIKSLRALREATDREVMQFLGYSDMNAVRPRITELINLAGILEECGSKEDIVTGKMVRIVKIKPNTNQLQLF